MPDTPATSTDVAVIGAGPAGAAAALTLCRLGRDVVLVDPVAPTELRIGESVPPTVRLVLAELGVSTDGHLDSLGTASAWGGSQLIYRDYLFDGLGNGWHLDRACFDRALTDAAVAAGAVLLRKRYLAASRSARRWTIACGGPGRAAGHELSASFVIDATGRRAAFGSGQGARRWVTDRLVAVAAILSGDTATASHTLIEAVPHGWWYAAPLPGRRLLVALLSDADIVRRYHWTDRPVWIDQLRRTEHIDAVLPTIDTAGPLVVRAANSQLLTPCLGAGWIAVGDAQLATDPLSSAGILTAITSGIDAARAITSGALADDATRRARDQRTRHKFAAYLRQREYFYRLEHRWDTPFWQRRHRPTTDPPLPQGARSAMTTANPSVP